MSTIFSGTMRCGELCQPAPSRISRAMAPRLTDVLISARCWFMASMLTVGMTRAATSEKTGLHRMEAGDSQALLALIADRRKKVAAKLGVEASVMSCFEAGRDGFWLHRLLSEHGVINHVVEPTSILGKRRARRAKTDRLDAQGLLRILTAHAKGDQ